MTAENIFSQRASMRSSPFRMVGGRLELRDDGTLGFIPTSFEQHLGGKRFECRTEDIVAVSLDPAGKHHWLTGGVRNRLHLKLRNGKEFYFVVIRPATTVPRLRSLILEDTSKE
jgi:hypothetical protein